VTATIHGLAHPGQVRERSITQPGSTPLSPSCSSPPTGVHAVHMPAHGRTCIINRNGPPAHTLPSGACTAPLSHPGATSSVGQVPSGGLPGSLVYKRLIQQFQRPMNVADERSALLALRPMNQEWGVIDKIESKAEQQLRAVESIHQCITECRAMRKPRMKEGVQVCYTMS
jgi:hypothetical protein